jgi:phosphatidylinositol alpha-mannosyltransferase
MFQFAGGVQEIVNQQYAYLVEQGHEVRIITPRPRKHDGIAPKDMILVGRSVKSNTPFKTMVDFGFQADTNEIEEILDREQFEILHFHEPWVPLLSRQILNKSQAINIATFHAKLPETATSKALANAVTPYTKSILKQLHVLTAVSEAAAEFVRSLTKQEIIIIPNGVDLSHFTPAAMPVKAKKQILYVGRLETRKGVEYLLSAYANLRNTHDDVELLIAGSGVKKKQLEKMVEQYEIPDVQFLGFVSEEQKLELLQTADLYSSPALYGESFGIVLLEAMAVGTPIVAGNNSGYASVMTGRGRLSLVNPKSTEEFTQRLELLLYDTELRNLWNHWAILEVKKYAFENVAQAYEATYKTALATNSYA